MLCFVGHMRRAKNSLSPRQPPVLFVMCTHVLLVMVPMVQVKKRERDKETTRVVPHGVPKGEHL